ncbi:transporter substrate-binding domain-containing protein [Cellvibrio sp. OA-2007]|uniref:transporter substrate-binding domain-containing protein n=1 Tax=Cellvibrio sp. OA-2007 TaxID=529823 RepID=UPI000AA97DB9|nr:transporter substrate-binding domain-containing protein [Cellvibrio sp. OA-2007]
MLQTGKPLGAQHATLVLIFFLACLSLETSAKDLRVVQGDNSIETYARGLLTLALSKLPEKYEVQQTIPSNSEERMVSMLIDNQLEVVWYATTNDLEERLLPIRIPIYRGLLGYRILMIKKGTQHKFDGIKTKEDLKRVSLGQGRFWADTNVLTANNLNVVKVLKYEGLFYMLDGDRFDAFPRGVHEPFAEMQRYPKLALDVEQNLLVSYTNPFYFFVNKNNHKLAQDIERGLRIAIEDGSYDKYFFNDPTVKDVINKANLKNRRIIHLDNPSLPKNTPLDDKSLWFDPYSIE